MKNTHISYEDLARAESVETLKPMLKQFFQQHVDQYKNSPESGEDIAYNMAGPITLDLVRGLPDNDPYSSVVYMASELELPKPHRDANISWRGLIKLVSTLR